MNETDYHAHAALSHSQLEDFIEPNGSPAIFWGRHIARCIPPREDTDASSLGTALHAAALEGDEVFNEKIAIWRGGPTEKGEHSMRRGTNAHKRWVEENRGRTLIDIEDASLVAKMLDDLRGHQDASELLWACAGESEKSLFWRDIHDVEARCRVDRVLPSADIIVDIKTARDVSPKARAKTIAERGYDRKAEWYRRGYVANYGRPLRAFMLIWVSTAETATAHDRIVVSRIGSVSESLSAYEIDRAVTDIVKRRESGDWRPHWCIDVQVDERASWAINRELLHEITP